jgi:DNA-binding PadR family transcriptional regulator
MARKHDAQKGGTSVWVLAVLADGPQHGYAIAREIEQRSGSALKPGEGTLYPALRGLEGDGFVQGVWEIQPSGPARKVYSLTEQGRAELTKQAQAWRDYARAVGGILGGQPDEQPV